MIVLVCSSYSGPFGVPPQMSQDWNTGLNKSHSYLHAKRPWIVLTNRIKRKSRHIRIIPWKYNLRQTAPARTGTSTCKQ